MHGTPYVPDSRGRPRMGDSPLWRCTYLEPNPITNPRGSARAKARGSPPFWEQALNREGGYEVAFLPGSEWCEDEWGSYGSGSLRSACLS